LIDDILLDLVRISNLPPASGHIDRASPTTRTHLDSTAPRRSGQEHGNLAPPSLAAVGRAVAVPRCSRTAARLSRLTFSLSRPRHDDPDHHEKHTRQVATTTESQNRNLTGREATTAARPAAGHRPGSPHPVAVGDSLPCHHWRPSEVGKRPHHISHHVKARGASNLLAAGDTPKAKGT
jgi:hypothetical protein